jgi:hypothetical protein
MKFVKKARTGLFFILMTFSNLNFLKICFGGKDPSELGILELLPSRGFFVHELPTLALHCYCGSPQ